MENLNKTELMVLAECVNNANSYGEEGGLCFEELRVNQLSENQLKGYVAQLVKKGYLKTAEECYFTHFLNNYQTYISGDRTLFTFNVLGKVNNNNNLNNNNMETNSNAPVMDERIVKLNEAKSVKMSKISSSKRTAAKFNKEVANYLLDNWDDVDKLKVCQSQMIKDMPHVSCGEFMDIYDARVSELSADVKEEQKEEDENDIIKLIEEKVKNAEKAGKMVFVADECHKLHELGWSIKKTDALLDKLTKKYNNDSKNSSKENKMPKKQAKSNDDKKEVKSSKTPKNARKVGDRHPKHHTWVWTEYDEGKFDWRINPQDKQKVGAKAKEDGASSKPKKEVKKPSKKSSKPAKEEPKHITIDEFKESSKGANKSTLSKAQKDAYKLIQKGWWIINNDSTYFFKNDNGETKSCNIDSVSAMFKKFKMDYIPEGLIKNEK